MFAVGFIGFVFGFDFGLYGGGVIVVVMVWC